MKRVNKNSLSERIKSFRPAFIGIKELLKQEPNFRIHIILLICAIFLGFFLHISRLEWLAIISISAVVLTAEAFNTAIENCCDLIDLNKNENIRVIKDIAAAAVLISAIAAFIVGLIIFLPKLLLMF